jgi:hypothetical protein
METERSYPEGSVLEIVEPRAESELRSSGSRGIIGGHEDGLPDMEPMGADELEPVEPIGAEQSNHEEVEERALGWRTWKMPTWKSMWANKKTTRLRQQRNLRRKKFKRHWIC